MEILTWKTPFWCPILSIKSSFQRFFNCHKAAGASPPVAGAAGSSSMGSSASSYVSSPWLSWILTWFHCKTVRLHVQFFETTIGNSLCATLSLHEMKSRTLGCLQNLRLQNFVIFLDHGMILICPTIISSTEIITLIVFRAHSKSSQRKLGTWSVPQGLGCLSGLDAMLALEGRELYMISSSSNSMRGKTWETRHTNHRRSTNQEIVSHPSQLKKKTMTQCHC